MRADRFQQVGHVMIVEPVVRMPPCSTNRDETCLAEDPQLLRSCAGGKSRRRRQLFDGSFLPEHRPQQPKSAGRPEGSHRLRKRLRLLGAERPAGRPVL